jgi:hypothetical protein
MPISASMASVACPTSSSRASWLLLFPFTMLHYYNNYYCCCR